MRDKNADRRNELGQMILAKERRIEALNSERRRFAEALDSYDGDMRASFEDVWVLHEEQLARGGEHFDRRHLEADTDLQCSTRAMALEHREGVDAMFAKTLRAAESEIGDLQKRQQGLPWG